MNIARGIFNTIAIALIAAGVIFLGLLAQTMFLAKQTVSVAPVAVEQVVAPNGEVKFERVQVSSEPAPKIDGKDDPEAWVHGVAAEAGLAFNVPMYVTSEGNCGEGCTLVTILNDKITHVSWVKIQPRVIGTEYGKFVVLHELGHANGIINECEADAFAHAHGGGSSFHDKHC